MSASLGVRSSALLLLINGIGFGWPCVLAIRSLRAGQGIPLFMGFPAYGLGPFERYGIATTVPLIVAFLAVCVLEVVAGVLLWNGSKLGGLLALGLIPFGAVFWWGFALPIPPLFAAARTMLMLINWRTLTLRRHSAAELRRARRNNSTEKGLTSHGAQCAVERSQAGRGAVRARAIGVSIEREFAGCFETPKDVRPP